MRKLRGQYTARGIAKSKLAVLESLARYQEAINLFDNNIKNLVILDSPIRVSIVGLAGSFAKGGGRLGIYRDITDISFDAVEEMQRQGKTHLRNGSLGYTGIYWSGITSEIYSYPSDLDILVNYDSSRPTSLTENDIVGDAVDGLSRAIFNKLGVFISATTDTRVGEFIPIEKIVGDGFIKLKTPSRETNLVH